MSESSELADLVIHALHNTHQFALRSIINETSTGLAYIYGAVPEINEEETNFIINRLSTTFALKSYPLDLHWQTLVESNVRAGVTDGYQIAGVRRLNRNQIRRQHVTDTQTFWLAFWNTYNPA